MQYRGGVFAPNVAKNVPKLSPPWTGRDLGNSMFSSVLHDGKVGVGQSLKGKVFH